jgi:uncharacterized protein
VMTAREFQFEWDAGNTEKSSVKHSVSPEEAEQVFWSGRGQPLGVQVSPSHPEERLGIVGPTDIGRILHIVFTFRGGRIRLISARPAKRKERKIYEAYLREIS